MSKMSFSKGGFGKFISSRGFYIALAVCLVGAGAATWLAVDRTIVGIERNNSQILESENFFTDFPLLEEVEQKQPNVPQSSQAPRPSSQTSSSSSGEPQKPQAQSEPSTAPQTSSQPSQPSSQPPAPASAPAPALTYAMPLRGDIITQYSNGELVKNITLGDWRTHDGVDIAADKGADICAAADGVVSEIKNDPLWGTVMVISHPDGNQTVYCGLDKNLPVKTGESVLVKQVIGKLDGVPCEISLKSHLHFAMRRDGVWVDPLSKMPTVS